MNNESIRFRDEYGSDAVKVPISNRPGSYAIADAADYDRIVAAGVSTR